MTVKITHEQRQLIAHTLGANGRYMKKDWGFRNHFMTEEGCDDIEQLRDLVKKGLMIEFLRFGDPVFSATKNGAIEIGFKPYQLRNCNFPE